MTPTFDITTLSAYRHCHFVLRDDHAAKPGGDVDLTNQIAGAAKAAGATVSVVRVADLPARLESDDLLFLLNIDRPYEAASALTRAHPDGRVLLYPLHHPVAGVEKYLRRVRGIKQVLGMVAGGKPERYEALVDVAKAARTRDLARLRGAIDRRGAVRRLIDRAELLVTSEAELAEIASHYGPPRCAAWLLPHPVAPYAAPPGTGLPPYVLVPGRIEPRKNQLAALQTLAALDLPRRGYQVLLLGGKGSDTGYFDATIHFALENGILYASQLPKSLFFPTVSGADLVINASFFEVTSLIDLYAIENAIPLVTTCHAYYAPSASLRQVDPLAWGSHAPPAVDAIEAMLALGSRLQPGG